MAYSRNKTRTSRKQELRKALRLTANAAGLTTEQVEQAADVLLAQGIEGVDIEVLPLGRRKCVIYWTGMEWDEITSPEDLKDMAARKYRSNRSRVTRKQGLTRTEARRLADEVVDLGGRVVSVGGGRYAVEVQSEHDYPVRITSIEDLRMVANRSRATRKQGLTRTEARRLADEVVDLGGRVVSVGGGRYAVEVQSEHDYPVRITSIDGLRMVANKGRGGRKVTTKTEASRIAREIKDEFEGVRVVSSGRGYAVEFLDDAGWPARISHLDQLSLIANGMRPNFFGKKKPVVPVDTSSMTKEEFIRHMGKDREWREAYLGMQSDFAMRDANAAFKRLTKDQIEATVAGKIADAKRRRKIAQDRASRGMVPNKGTELRSEIVEGIACGLWPMVDGVEYDEEALKVALDFYHVTTKINREMTLAKFYEALPSKKASPKEFGYYLAMQANGEGVSYWDSYDGVDGVQLVLPEVEAHSEAGDLFFSWDPGRLHHAVWLG